MQILTIAIESGPTAGQQARTNGNRIVVGREDSVDIVIFDPIMSRRHFEIFPDGKLWQICDLESRNGTFLNGQPIKQETLRNGDQVQAGCTSFRITLSTITSSQPHFETKVPRNSFHKNKLSNSDTWRSD